MVKQIAAALAIEIFVLAKVKNTIKIDQELLEEIKENNPKVLAEINEYFAGQEIEVEFVSHVGLKEKTKECKAVIRTGETTPYANIILQSGCIF